ncbi:MAG: thiosulfate oxidation carrier protein SoxY [Rubrivivax sp.]
MTAPCLADLRRRRVLAAGAAGVSGALLLHRRARAAGDADTPALAAALARFASGGALREGRVQLELPELVENGNAVPVMISMPTLHGSTERVTALALFAGRNPLPEVAVFELHGHSGTARVATRMRLATSQAVVAAARLADGSVWTRRVDVLVTLAACIEG